MDKLYQASHVLHVKKMHSYITCLLTGNTEYLLYGYVFHSDMDVVHEVLTVLYVFSKRSNFMGRLSPAKKREIVIRLLYLAEVIYYKHSCIT